jgi:hypothetical protein
MNTLDTPVMTTSIHERKRLDESQQRYEHRLVMVKLLMHHEGSWLKVDPLLDLNLEGIVPQDLRHLGYFQVQVIDTDHKSLYKTRMNANEIYRLMTQLATSRADYKRASERMLEDKGLAFKEAEANTEY